MSVAAESSNAAAVAGNAAAGANATFDSHTPATGEVLESYPIADRAAVDAAVDLL